MARNEKRAPEIKHFPSAEVEDKQYRRFTEWCEDEATSRKYEIENAQAKAETLAAAIEKEASNIGVASATIEELGGQVRLFFPRTARRRTDTSPILGHNTHM